jgi:hypothetical protein
MPWRETSAVRGQSEDGLQVVARLRAGGPGRAAGRLASPAHIAPSHAASVGAVDPGLAAPLYVGCAQGAPPAAVPRPGRPGTHQDHDPPHPRAAWASAPAAAQPAALPCGRTRHTDESAQRRAARPSPRVDRARAPGAERAARAHAQDAQGRDGAPAAERRRVSALPGEKWALPNVTQSV